MDNLGFLKFISYRSSVNTQRKGDDFMFTKNNGSVNYRNDVFFKFALSSEDEDSKMIRHFIIKEITGIDPVDSHVLNEEMNPEVLNGKKIILDVHVRDIHGRNTGDGSILRYASRRNVHKTCETLRILWSDNSTKTIK